MQSGHGLALALAVALRGVRGVGEAGLASVARASGGLGGMGEAQYSEAAVFLDVTAGRGNSRRNLPSAPRARGRRLYPPPPSAAALAAHRARHAADAAAGRCVPPRAEAASVHNYGFSGIHYVRQLRAWFYEVPKSGSTTMVTFFHLRNGGRAQVPPGGPAPGDIGFVVARHPVERAVSAFHTAYSRAVGRTNSTNTQCPYRKFPYLQANISDSDGLSSAVALLGERGAELADASCGYAYHHMLSQAFFLWRERVRLLYSRSPPKGQLLARDDQLPSPVSVVLRLESLAEDLLALCAARNATAYCQKRIEQLGGIKSLNPSHKARLTDAAIRAAQRYYAPDFGCLGYGMAPEEGK